MAVSYNPLWHLLIEKGMKKKDLRERTGICNIVKGVDTFFKCKFQEITSLTSIAKKRTGIKNVPGSSYFTYQGESLIDVANRTQWKDL